MKDQRERGYDILYIMLFALWLIFNGRITMEIVLFGVAISALCCGASFVLFGYTPKKDIMLLKKSGLIVKLLFCLFAEIIKANIAVIRIIYEKKQPSPLFTEFESPVSSSAAKAALADCITLTPGTITAQIENGKYTVHCLAPAMASGMEDGTLAKQLRELEGGSKEK